MLQNHFSVCSVHEQKQAAWFSNQYSVTLEPIAQGPGVVGDYTVVQSSPAFEEAFPGYRTIEFKHDKTSEKWGSLFVEFEQTRDYWRSKKVSGHLKAVINDCLLVIQSGRSFFCFKKEDFMSIFRITKKERTTCRGANGNLPGMHTRAKIFPMQVVKLYASRTFKVPEET